LSCLYLRVCAVDTPEDYDDVIIIGQNAIDVTGESHAFIPLMSLSGQE